MKSLSSNMLVIALFVCNSLSSVCHSSLFIKEHRNGFTIAGEVNRYENNVLFNNIRMIRYARNESLLDVSSDYDSLENLLEKRNGNYDISGEELSLFIDNFKDTSVIRKLLPMSFFVSEITDKPIYITDIQSKGDVFIAHGNVTKQSNDRVTFVFIKRNMLFGKSDDTWSLRKIYLYKSHLDFDDLDRAIEEISFTEVQTDNYRKLLVCGNDPKRIYPTSVSIQLLSLATSVFSVVIIIITPIVALYIPRMLHSIQRRLELTQ
ncbi:MULTISPECIES: hypothetical protein [unclassified Endozoicomonas]|uniref:hypothetical protein n=1 Tax=unclassified Endozoicomonas TaxID=2644528 RepID=UPI0021494D12|nr:MULTISPECIES: hypothetical protein [unclassified Endozoicomonas]